MLVSPRRSGFVVRGDRVVLVRRLLLCSSIAILAYFTTLDFMDQSGNVSGDPLFTKPTLLGPSNLYGSPRGSESVQRNILSKPASHGSSSSPSVHVGLGQRPSISSSHQIVKLVTIQDDDVQRQVEAVLHRAAAVSRKQEPPILIKQQDNMASVVRSVPTKAKMDPLSKETRDAMQAGEEAGLAADQAAKARAQVEAEETYQRLRKAMYAEEQEAERKERASRDSHKGLTISEDNDKLLKDLDTVYEHDPTASDRPAKGLVNQTIESHAEIQPAHTRIDLHDLRSAGSPHVPKPVSHKTEKPEALRKYVAGEMQVHAMSEAEAYARALPSATVVAVLKPMSTVLNPAKGGVGNSRIRPKSVDAPESGGLGAIFRQWLQSW